MAKPEILDGKVNIAVEARSGNVVARGGNYILNANPADIANYAREGADLVVEFVNGERLVLRDFFSGANNLVLSDGGNMQLIDFSASMGGADGISDAAVGMEAVAGSGGANMALLGLLGVAAAGAGVAVAAAGSGSDKNANGNAGGTGKPGEGGNTDGGNTDGGNTDGGNTDGGNTDGGNTDGGNTDGGNLDKNFFNLSDYLDLGGNGEIFTGEMMADMPAPANISYIEEDFAASMAAASQIII